MRFGTFFLRKRLQRYGIIRTFDAAN